MGLYLFLPFLSHHSYALKKFLVIGNVIELNTVTAHDLQKKIVL